MKPNSGSRTRELRISTKRAPVFISLLLFYPSNALVSQDTRIRHTPTVAETSYADELVHADDGTMADLQGRKVFKVFNQDFIVDERYTVTKELGQGAYGIVW